MQLHRAEQMGLSIIYLSNWKLCGGNFRSIVHYMWQQLTHLCENIARTQLWINATWTGRDMRDRDASEGLVHTRRYTRIYAVGFMSTYLLAMQHRRTSPVGTKARLRETQPYAKSWCTAGFSLWTSFYNRNAGTGHAPTHVRACVPTCARGRLAADGWRWTLFEHVHVILRRFPRRKRSRPGKYIAAAEGISLRDLSAVSAGEQFAINLTLGCAL